jgi:enoyl-CoA hydratase/carnithine racemase
VIVEERQDGILRLLIDRPPANALSTATVRDLAERLQAAGGDPDVAAVVVGGTGERFFTAGGDFKELAGAAAAEGEVRVRQGHRLLVTMHTLTCPLVCAVNGDAVGIGTEFCAFADWTVAVPEARFGMPEINHGLLPMAIGIRELSRVIGLRHARRLLYSGDLISADEARRLGLVDEVAPLGQLRELSFRRARELGAKPGPLFGAIKRTLRIGELLSDDELEAMTVRDFHDYFDAVDARSSLVALARRSASNDT